MVDVELFDGLKVGDACHKKVQMRRPLAGDLLDAHADAEKLLLTHNGYELAVSPTLVAAHVIRRQVVSLGDIEGPIELSVLRKLSQADYELLNDAAVNIDRAQIAQAAKLGK